MAGVDADTAIDGLTKQELSERLDKLVKDCADLNHELALAEMRIEDLHDFVKVVKDLREIPVNSLEWHDALALVFDKAGRL
jgi:hypothetical protein